MSDTHRFDSERLSAHLEPSPSADRILGKAKTCGSETPCISRNRSAGEETNVIIQAQPTTEAPVKFRDWCSHYLPL